MQEVTMLSAKDGSNNPVSVLALDTYPLANGQSFPDPEAYIGFQNQSEADMWFTMDGTDASDTNGFHVAAGAFYERKGTAVSLGKINVYASAINSQFHIIRGASKA
jgi:hypothetical protein